ncbi:type II secretion system F family protein [Candidatus Microgenomates bacterium]|nr:type II secretion system F family protein [Candidatus Microgenomates bacterium]
MRQFNYQARNPEGKKMVGKVEAASAEAAARVLREKGLIVIKIESGLNLLEGLKNFRGKVNLSEVATFTRQFSTMISAGVTITESLSILRTQSAGHMSQIAGNLLMDIEGGSSLAAALEKHPQVFSPVYIALVRAAETGGLLDTVLARLADNLEKEREFRSKVKGALIYPMIVIIGMAAVVTVMMVFVVPKLAKIYEEFNAKLPGVTVALINVSHFMTKFWYLMAMAIIILIWGLGMFRKTPVGKRAWDGFMLKVPIMGPLNRQIMLTEFTRTLGLLVGAGVSILESLGVVSRIVGNEILASGVRTATRDVEKGFPLAWALGQQPQAFPPMMTRMIAVGEETGKLNEILEKTSHIYEQDSEQQVKALTSAIEPIVMVVLGLGVGILVIAIILPIYNLTSQF